jgi:hypothetical protein
LVPASSHASITVGSDLSLPTSGFTDNCILSTPPCTRLLVGVHPGNTFPVKSPTKGIVTSFRIKSGGSNPNWETVTFRLGRLSTSLPAKATGAGTGPSLTFNTAGIHTVAANLPVNVGDYVGIDTSATSAASAYPTDCAPGMGYVILHPPLIDFGSPQSVDSNSICELLVDAVIQPSTQVGFLGKNQKYTVNKKGKIILPIELPGPGSIKISGKGLARQGVRTVNEAGVVKLPIKLAARTLRRLDASGKAAVKVKITFTPVGGDPGTLERKLKLRAG